MRTAFRPVDYLEHIQLAIERIIAFTAGLDEAAFLTNMLVQDATVRNLQIAGEAAWRLERDYPSFIAAHEALPWRSMAGMRHRLVHDYFDVNLALVWRTVRELPKLRQELVALLEQCRQ